MKNLICALTFILGASSVAQAATCTISFNLDFQPGTGLSAFHPDVAAAVESLLTETGCTRTDNQESDYRVQLGYYEQTEGYFKAGGPQFFYVSVHGKDHAEILKKRSRFVKLEARDFDKRGVRFLSENLANAAEKITLDLIP